MKKRKKFEKYQHNKLSRGARVSEIKQYEELMNTRRSLRDFSKEEVEIEIIEKIISVAASSPSGANK